MTKLGFVLGDCRLTILTFTLVRLMSVPDVSFLLKEKRLRVECAPETCSWSCRA